MMREGSRKPFENAASNEQSAQPAIEPSAHAQGDLAALIDRTTDDNRHDLLDTGPPVGREFC